MVLKGVWFVIAGVLLLSHTPTLAEQYLRVCKNGVVYYYFASREPSQHKRPDKNTPKLRGEAWIEMPSPRSGPSLSAIKAPSPAPAAAHLAAAPLQDALDPTPLPPVRPPEVPENVGAATRHLISLLTRLASSYYPVRPATAVSPHWLGSPQEIARSQESRIMIPDAWVDLLKSAQEPSVALVQTPAGPGYWLAPTPTRGYCFPVGGPYSFRDTWGDWRSGGRVHRAADIFASEGTPVYAVTAGVIDNLTALPEAGIILLMRGHDGRGYGYMHLQGFAPGIMAGKTVRAGELLGYVGRTGLRESAAHLHFQVYADHRLCRDDLLNPHSFLVQLCHGVGVTDLNQPRIARLEQPRIARIMESGIARLEEPEIKGNRILEEHEIKGNRIQVYRQPHSKTLSRRDGQLNAKRSSTLVIRNF